MGFLDSILGMFGIGQPKISMVISTSTVKQGGLVQVTVSITGGRRPLPLTSVIVKVKQKEEVKTESGTSTNTDTKFELVFPEGGRVIEPNQTFSRDFIIQVPADIAPTGGKITHEIEGSADVPGWDPAAEQAITILGEQDEYAAEDLKRYQVLATERHFRHSSVHGDYRLLAISGGFATTWKTEIVLRNSDGSERGRIPGWGKSFAASPDGTKIVSSNAYKQVAIFDATSGAMLAGPFDMGDWIFDVLWLPDQTLLASVSEKIFLMTPEGEITGTLEQLGGSGFYVGGLAPAPSGAFYVTDSNGSRVLKADKSGNVQAQIQLRSPSALFSLPDGRVAVESNDDVTILDANLKKISQWKLPGQEGVRYLGQSEYSHTHFKPMPHLSLDGKQVLVQNGSGLLWRMNAESEEAIQAYDRSIVDYVEDTLWVDAEHFLAITNDGKVRKVSSMGTVVFEFQDV